MPNVDDHGLEVLKKAARDIGTKPKTDYSLQVHVMNPAAPPSDNFRNQVLTANDLAEDNVWLDFGTCRQRIDSITYSAASVSSTQSIRKKYNYTQIGNKYRFDSIQWEIQND